MCYVRVFIRAFIWGFNYVGVVVKLIHVTEVMSPFMDFSMIKPEVLEYASERGTRIHSVISDMLNGYWLPKIDDDIKGYIQSFRFFRNNIFRTVFTEKTFEDELYGLTGTLDFGGYLKDRPKDFTIIDWKSPVNTSRTWHGQLCCYAYLVEKNTDLNVKRIGSFQPDPKGGPGKMNWYKDSARVWEAYLCALHAYRFFKLGG